MANDEKWYMIILLLYDLEINEKFEKFAKEKSLIDINDKVINMNYEDLSMSVRLFLDQEVIEVENIRKKVELLRFCTI